MIRKYKMLVKSWELERPKQVLPFPDGIVAQAPASAPPDSTPEEWVEVMGPSSRWTTDADASGWGIELAGLARATEELSLAVDTVLSRTESGDVLERWTVELILIQLAALFASWDRRENKLCEQVLPWLEPRADEKERKALQNLRRGYGRRRKRTELLRGTLEKALEAAEKGEEGKGAQVYAMRCVKDSYDVFQSMGLVSSQVEVETAMWVARKRLSESEFNALWIQSGPTTARAPVLRPGALATLGSKRHERLTWLRCQGVPDWLCSVYVYGVILISLGTWQRPIDALMLNKKHDTTILTRLFKTTSNPDPTASV